MCKIKNKYKESVELIWIKSTKNLLLLKQAQCSVIKKMFNFEWNEKYKESVELITPGGQLMVDSVTQWFDDTFKHCTNSQFRWTSNVLVSCKVVDCSPDTSGCCCFKRCCAVVMCLSCNNWWERDPRSFASCNVNVVSPMTVQFSWGGSLIPPCSFVRSTMGVSALVKLMFTQCLPGWQ